MCGNRDQQPTAESASRQLAATGRVVRGGAANSEHLSGLLNVMVALPSSCPRENGVACVMSGPPWGTGRAPGCSTTAGASY